MAAFVTLTDGTTTKYLTNAGGGDYYNDRFYEPAIRSLSNPKFGGEDYARLRDCTLKVDFEFVNIWTGVADRQLDCTLVMYDGTTAITYDNLKAVRFGKGQTYTYQIVSEKVTADLLTAAPDIKATGTDPDLFTQNRFYPRVFGTVKHVKPFLLVQDVLKYYSGGELYECYSRGQTQTVTKAADKTFTASTSIVEPFTMDVENAAQTAETLSRKIVRPENFVFRQATAPSSSLYLLTEGMTWVDSDDENQTWRWNGTAWQSVRDGTIATAQSTADGKNTIYYQTTAPVGANTDDLWFDTDDNNKEYVWSGAAWVSARDGRVASGLNDSGEITQIVKGPNLPTTGMVAGLNVTQNFMGYYSGAAWNAYIANDGDFFFRGDDDHYIQWDGTNFEINGITLSSNGSDTTATRLTINGGTAPSSGLTTSTRLSFVPTEDGQYHSYAWNGTNGWTELASIGISSAGGDSTVGVFYGGSNFGIYASSTSNRAITAFSGGVGVRSTTTGSTKAFEGIASSSGGIGGSFGGSSIGAEGTTAVGASFSAELSAAVATDSTHIRFNKAGTSGAPTHSVTDPSLIVASTGDLYFNAGGGTTWTKLN